MTKVKATTTKKLKKHFAHYADWVNQHDGAVIVTRDHHRNVVMISKAEYETWQRTLNAWSTLTQNEDLQQSMDELTNADESTTADTTPPADDEA